MKSKLVSLILLLLSLFQYACKNNKNQIRIGTQVWATENLNISSFSNGDPIPEATSVDEWRKAYDEGKPVWCYYNFDRTYEESYGKLYNIHAVTDIRGLAPKGWHIPNNDEWNTLINYLGGDTVAGKKLKSIEGWKSYNGKNGNGTNSSGFDAKPGGIFSYNMWAKWEGEYGKWWSSSSSESPDGCYMGIGFRSDLAEVHCGFNMGSAYSVRCIKD